MSDKHVGEANTPFTTSNSSIMSLLGKDLGDYHIVRLLAKGGMGIVYQAEQISLNRKVALKILPNDLINEFVSLERFKMEAQSVANLNHPNIVQIYQFAEWQNTHFFAMEYIEGKTLEEILHIKNNSNDHASNRIPLDWATDIIIQVMRALDYAHNKAVIHRDIKPANIMLDVSGRVFLTDFGLAKNLNLEKMEGEGLTVGTPEYMSPEQAAGEVVDWRTDIYSVGLVLYEMLTGDTPYQGNSPVSIIANRIVKEQVRSPREFNPGIPEEIERIILKSVAKNRSERYQSAKEFLSALEKFRSEQEISEIVKTATAKEKARAKAELEKEKEKVQAVIVREKMKADIQLAQNKKELKRKELIKLLKISLKASVFVSIIYLMLFLIYETHVEEDRIKRDIARQLSQDIEMTETDPEPGISDIPDALIVQPEKQQAVVTAVTLSVQPAVAAVQESASLSQKDIDWVQTQFQLGKNYEFVQRKDLAIESYMKIIRKYPDSDYAEKARQNIRLLE
ncbi:MAG: protein kinase [Candidatus Auribacterota bacterium]